MLKGSESSQDLLPRLSELSALSLSLGERACSTQHKYGGRLYPLPPLPNGSECLTKPRLNPSTIREGKGQQLKCGLGRKARQSFRAPAYKCQLKVLGKMIHTESFVEDISSGFAEVHVS